jgi:tRNA(adenine34) deaminase
MNFDNKHMRRALENALFAGTSNEVPVGAVIVRRETDEVISTGYNKVEIENNPMRHAEIVAIEAACKLLKSKNLSDCDMYVTLEPCAMCAAATSFARIGRLFYGAADEKQGAIENGPRFFTQSTCLHRPEVYEGIMAEESADLMRNFFCNLRG